MEDNLFILIEYNKFIEKITCSIAFRHTYQRFLISSCSLFGFCKKVINRIHSHKQQTAVFVPVS